MKITALKTVVGNAEMRNGVSEVDEVAAARHSFKQEVRRSLSIHAPDGAVLDWRFIR
jgi:hypothetical protein